MDRGSALLLAAGLVLVLGLAIAISARLVRRHWVAGAVSDKQLVAGLSSIPALLLVLAGVSVATTGHKSFLQVFVVLVAAFGGAALGSWLVYRCGLPLMQDVRANIVAARASRHVDPFGDAPRPAKAFIALLMVVVFAAPWVALVLIVALWLSGH